VAATGETGAQAFRQRGVQLDGDQAPGARGQMPRKGAAPRSDLNNQRLGVRTNRRGNPLQNGFAR